MRGWVRREAVPLLVVLVAALILGPALRPGYTLVGDQVFVPDQSLLPWMLGLGAGLPRSVPQDAVVALLTGPVPGWVWETVALVAALVLLGLGTARLLSRAGTSTRCLAAVLAMWSPYVAERLLIGHWSLLLAVAALPWALAAADAVRRRQRTAGARWLMWLALASLTPSGGLLVLLVSAPLVLWRSAVPWYRRALLAGAGLLLQLPWVVPSLLHPAAASGVEGVEVFALRSEGPWGVLLTALGTGGLWNADAVPGSRGTVLAPVATLVLLALAIAGRRAVPRALGRPLALTLAVAAGAGLLVALVGAWEVTRPLTSWVVATVPGGGLVRDGQKWLAPWLLLLAVAAALGARRAARALARRTRDRTVGRVVLVAVVLLPLATLPDLAWGALGRLSSVDYPDDWTQARAVLATDPAPGDVVSLPWATFRRFDWNLGRTVLDPAPRAMPRTVVGDASLVVRRGSELVVVPGDDPRAARIGAALASGDDLGPVLAAEGVGWALVTGGAGAVTLPAGAQRVVDGAGLDLYRLDAAPDAVPRPGGVPLVLAADALAVLVLLGAALAAVRGRGPGTGPGPDTQFARKAVPGATGW